MLCPGTVEQILCLLQYNDIVAHMHIVCVGVQVSKQ